MAAASAARFLVDPAPLTVDAAALLEVAPVRYRLQDDPGDVQRVGLPAEQIAAAGLGHLVRLELTPGAPDHGQPVAVDLEGYVVVLHELLRQQAAQLAALTDRFNRQAGMS